MTAAYVPQVGDTVQHPVFPSQALAVVAVGRHHMLAVNEHGDEVTYLLATKWTRVVKPTPLSNCWYYTTASGFLSYPKDSRAIALDHASGYAAAILHIWTDADGVDHAEIERIER